MSLRYKSDELQVFQISGDGIGSAKVFWNGVGVIPLYQRTLRSGGDVITPLPCNQVAEHVHVAVLVTHHLVRIVGGTAGLRAQNIVLKDGYIQLVGTVFFISGVI